MDAAGENARLMGAAAWLGRRLILPALAATVAIVALVSLLLILPERGWPPIEGALDFALMMSVLTIIPVLGGLVLIGIPAGLLVARLEHGFVVSLLELSALGTVAGVVVTLATPLGVAAMTDPEIVPIFASAGLVTAALWTVINRDLFRFDDGA